MIGSSTRGYAIGFVGEKQATHESAQAPPPPRCWAPDEVSQCRSAVKKMEGQVTERSVRKNGGCPRGADESSPTSRYLGGITTWFFDQEVCI